MKKFDNFLFMNCFFKIRLNNQNKILKKNQKINLYVCGPTVYNHIHIGNARPLIVFDILFRLLRFLGYKVNYVQNVTDIDDKIITTAVKQNVSEAFVSQKFLAEYNKICQKLNAFNFSQELVSTNIDKIITFIQKLIKNDYAYVTKNAVYFDISKIKNYGKHANRLLNDPIIGEKNKTKDKKNDADFALWKTTKQGLRWESPWGEGRPGWHTECVAIIEKKFGKNLTVHGGGIDLKFPHHENEIAQFYALHHTDLTKFWIYVGHVTMNNEKMSKSLNNFVYVKDALQKFDSNSLRWWFLSVTPQLPMNYEEKKITESANEWAKIVRTINRLKTHLILNNIDLKKTTEISAKCIQKLATGLDLSSFVTEIYKIVREANSELKANNFRSLQKKWNILHNTLTIIGFKMTNFHTTKNIKLLKKWKKTLAMKKFSLADEIRCKLMQMKLI